MSSCYCYIDLLRSSTIHKPSIMNPRRKIIVAFVSAAVIIVIALTYQEEISESSLVRAIYYKTVRQYHRVKYHVSGKYQPSYYVPGRGTIITSRFTPEPDIHISGTTAFEAIYFADDIGAQVSKIDNRGNVLWQFQGNDKTRSLFRHKNQIGFVDGEQIKFVDSTYGVLANRMTPGIGRLSCAHITPPPHFSLREFPKIKQYLAGGLNQRNKKTTGLHRRVICARS